MTIIIIIIIIIIIRHVFPLRIIHKYTWTSAGGKTRNQIVYILIDRRWRSSIPDVRHLEDPGVEGRMILTLRLPD